MLYQEYMPLFAAATAAAAAAAAKAVGSSQQSATMRYVFVSINSCDGWRHCSCQHMPVESMPALPTEQLVDTSLLLLEPPA
jgi:hypothetical protein